MIMEKREQSESCVPFFVVDRPISLHILSGLEIPPGKRIGLMARANTSQRFRQLFRDFPAHGIEHHQVVKMCDSAIFERERLRYEELFSAYEQMGADYGVMIDAWQDALKTLESARRALEVYDPGRHHFRLVAVAQGRTVSDYLSSYEKLRRLGFRYIAVGGLLQKRERSARYSSVANERLMREVLIRIKSEHKPDWLFALGCLHPSRLPFFKELGVWADYKGWLFQYRKRDETVNLHLRQLEQALQEQDRPAAAGKVKRP